jgi:hypothetical protein
MDIKRVAFETKPVNKGFAIHEGKEGAAINSTPTRSRQPARREEIAAIVDKFLSRKIEETPDIVTNVGISEKVSGPESPVKTIIHELRSGSTNENGARPLPVDFVSEDDVRRAIASGQKILITAKTILTPSARDLGEEKEIFARA